MESNLKSELKVGLFVAFGTVVILVSILLLGGDQMLFRDTYDLKTHFDDVQGLGPGSVVSLSGIPVGNVRNIDLNSTSNQIEVTLEIDSDFQNRITKGSTVSVRTQGALGDRYIYISPGPTDGTPLPEYGVIPSETRTGLIDAITDSNSELANILDVIKEVHTLFRNINSDGRSALLMENLVSSSENLDKLLIEARHTLLDLRGKSDKENHLRQSLDHFASVMRKIDQGKGTLGALINDPALHEKLTSLLGDSPRNKYLKPLIRQTIRESESK